MTVARRRHRLLAGAMLLVALCGGVLAAGQGAQVVWRGAELSDGRLPLTGGLQGHDDPLPAEALRCANCHEGSTAVAPRLDRGLLQQAQPRRGGPPSSYDETSFCRLLREGLDPAHVLLPREMPRYRIDDRDCAALWAYLNRS
jgi:hypothetical protein